jgi:hypothetical protein
MNLREHVRQQSIARHRKPDARLPVLINQQRRKHSEQRPDGHREAQVIHPDRL